MDELHLKITPRPGITRPLVTAHWITGNFAFCALCEHTLPVLRGEERAPVPVMTLEFTSGVARRFLLELCYVHYLELLQDLAACLVDLAASYPEGGERK